MDAEAHSKTSDQKRDIQRRIVNLEQDLITQVATPDDHAAFDLQRNLMGVLQRKLAELTAEVNRNVEKAWMEYWGVWGKGEYEIVQERKPFLELLPY